MSVPILIALQSKTGIYLLQDGNEEPFNVRLHLAKDILTLQEQDVICVTGEPFYSSVSNPLIQCEIKKALGHGKCSGDVSQKHL